jgi:hypothetical protein
MKLPGAGTSFCVRSPRNLRTNVWLNTPLCALLVLSLCSALSSSPAWAQSPPASAQSPISAKSPASALSAAPPPAPDFAITDFTVWSTLPGPDGQRRMVVSFRVTNIGTAPGPAMRTRVTIAGVVSEFTNPVLQPQASIFISKTLSTTASQVPIRIEADVNHVITESNEQNNVLEYAANPAGDIGRWQNIGPSKIGTNPEESGRVSTIAVSPVSPFIVYAGGRDSGLWKTEGLTTVWFPITDSLPTQKIDAVAIDPRQNDRILIATPAGFFQSLDDGTMWTQLTNVDLRGVGSDGGHLLVENLTNSPLVLSTLEGVKVSTDGGQTWTTVLASGSPVISLQFSTTDPSHLFASTAAPPGVFEANNNGLTAASWHQLQGCPDAPLPAFPQSASVWITESQGTQWMSFRTKTPDPLDFQLWRTTSETCNIGGFVEHGWQKLDLSNGGCNNYLFHWSYLFAHPNDPTLVFKSGIKLCRSTSSGDNLGKVDGIHDDQHAIVVAQSSPSVMFFGSDGGIYRSPDKGQTMNFLGEGMSNAEFLKVAVNGTGSAAIMGGMQDNATAGWNGSAIWTDLGAALISGDVPLVAFERTDMKGIYKMGQSTQQIEYDPASGDHWSSRGSLDDCLAYNEFPGQVFESMESTGDNPPLLVTCHGIWSGPPWNQIKTTTQGEFVRLALAPDNPQIAVAATSNGHVFWGAALQPSLLYDVFTAPNGGGPSGIAMKSSTMFYVAHNAGGQGIITRFACFLGCTTESIWPGTPSGDVTAVGIDPLVADTVLAAIDGNGIFRGTRSSAGQWTWTPYTNGIPVGANVTDIQPRSDGSIAAATYGRGMFLSTSISTAPPKNTAKGHITNLDVEADDSKPGKPIQKFVSVELDSKPGYLFTETGIGYLSILQAAYKNHTSVQIEYTPQGQNSGKIVKVTNAGP